jgi:POT family proton-dependent oligopeptide transporter
MNKTALARADDVAFIGHPRGLFYLALTEAWERFSYYGMTALLALYMVNQLLLPGNVEQIAGFAGFRAALESVFGPLSTQALASQIFGLYSAFVYFTPLLGGIIADRWIGQRNAVVIGALAMSAGHIAMTFDRSFLLALLLLVIGSGFLKGNISAQVGALYPREDEKRRTRGFVIFSTAINIGAVLGPLLCGFLAQAYGWHYGFGVAAIFMLVVLGVYLYGYRHLPARVERLHPQGAPLSAADRRTIGALIAVMAITILPSAAMYQLFNVNPIWIQQHVVPEVGGFQVPVPWYQSLNSVFSILAVPLLFWIWRLQSSRGSEPGELAKIGTGAWLTAASNLVLVGAILGSGGRAIHPVWPFLGHVHEEVDVVSDIALRHGREVFLDLEQEAISAIVHVFLVEGVPYLIRFRGTGAAERVVAPARVRDDGEEHVTIGRAELRARREVDVGLFADGVDGAIAVGRVVRVVKKRVDRLVTFEIDDSKNLTAADRLRETQARIEGVIERGAARIERAFGECHGVPPKRSTHPSEQTRARSLGTPCDTRRRVPRPDRFGATARLVSVRTFPKGRAGAGCSKARRARSCPL